MKNYHIIEIKYLGPTTNNSARVQLFSPRFKERKVIRYDHSLNSIAEMAERYLIGRGFEVVGMAESKEGYYIITNTFQSIK